jgi:hypothetical protein
MQERREHAVHHPDVIVPGELLLHVNEIAIHRIEPSRDQLANMQANGR